MAFPCRSLVGWSWTKQPGHAQCIPPDANSAAAATFQRCQAQFYRCGWDGYSAKLRCLHGVTAVLGTSEHLVKQANKIFFSARASNRASNQAFNSYDSLTITMHWPFIESSEWPSRAVTRSLSSQSFHRAHTLKCCWLLDINHLFIMNWRSCSCLLPMGSRYYGSWLFSWIQTYCVCLFSLLSNYVVMIPYCWPLTSTNHGLHYIYIYI